MPDKREAVHAGRAVHRAVATIRYTIPMPGDSPLIGGKAEDVALGGRVLSTVKFGGPDLTVGSTTFEVLFAL